MINTKVFVQHDGKQLHGRVVGQQVMVDNRMFLMVELGDDTPDTNQHQPEVRRTIVEAIRGQKHVWVSENDANYLLELGLVPTKGGEKLRSKSFGMFNGIKVNVDTVLMQGEYYTLDGKRHRV